MILPTWKKVNRKRMLNISHLSPMFVDYYDLDSEDFTELVLKLKNKERLSDSENERYGKYILTICLIVLEGPKFKKKPQQEKEEVIEQQYYELLQGITTFNPERGSKLFSYAYRIAYVAAVHYYTGKQQDKLEEDAIVEHCERELLDYYDACFTHKTPRR